MYLLSDTCAHLHISNGGVTYDKQGQPPAPDGNWVIGTVASFYCNMGYHRSSTIPRTCQISGDWTGQNPVCNESKFFEFVQSAEFQCDFISIILFHNFFMLFC